MNVDFNELHNNKEIRLLGLKATSKFKKLSKEERDSCIYNALFKACKSFDKDKNVKFTTYFYRGVVLECLTLYKFLFSNKKRQVNIPDKIDIVYNDNRLKFIEFLDMIKDSEDKDILVDRFCNNKTLREIAAKNNISIETARIKIQQNITNLKNKYYT